MQKNDKSGKVEDGTSEFLTRHHEPRSFHTRGPTRESNIDGMVAMVRAGLRTLRIDALLTARNSLHRALRKSIIHRVEAGVVRTAVIGSTVAVGVVTDVKLRRSHGLLVLGPAVAFRVGDTGVSGSFDWLVRAGRCSMISRVVVVVHVVLRAGVHTRDAWKWMAMMVVSHWSRDLCAG